MPELARGRTAAPPTTSRTPAARSLLLLTLTLMGIACGGAALSACGQKGQLYLPSQKKSKVPPTQPPQSAPPAGTTPSTPDTTAPTPTAAAPS